MTAKRHHDGESGQGTVTVAAIDIGSNALRMSIAEVDAAGRTEVLEKLRREVRLGQDSFRRGRITRRTMRAAVAVLRDYRRRMDFYGVSKVRAVATSAVREAANADAFLDRVFMATGLEIEIIDTSEESRLTVSSVRQVARKVLTVTQAPVLVADVGGGSALLTVLQRGRIVASQSVALGAIRLREGLGQGDESGQRAAEIIGQQISNVVAAVRSALPLARVRMFVAVGGDARFAAQHVGSDTASPGISTVSPEALERLTARCGVLSVEDLARRYALAHADADTLGPALQVYQALLGATRAAEMLVSQVSMRDGLLLDLGRTVTGKEDRSVARAVISSARAVAQKYRVDRKHSSHVASLAVRLFDELQDEHGLGRRSRLVLQVASLMHEVGGFVSSRAHHKHSYYLISNSEVYGLKRRELEIAAHIARYHRRNCPRPAHVEYMALSREGRMAVSKLAALLRLADALDRAHAQRVRDFTCERRGEDFIINVHGVTELGIERRAVSAKGDLFEDVYCLRIRLEEAPARGA